MNHSNVSLYNAKKKASETKVICLVPVKNEAWILRNFIECARQWADLIIVGDDDSTDDSVSIVKEYAFVKLIARCNPPFDEDIRRKILIDEARKITGKRLIFCLDADEMISANWAKSKEWDVMLNSQQGTSFHFEWLEILPQLDKCAIYDKVVAFVDDGSEYRGLKKDSPKIPSMTGERIKLRDIKLLHYINIDLERMLSKHRWYKCFEYIENLKRPWDICIRYQDRKIKTYDAPVIPVRKDWIKGYDWLDEYRMKKENRDKCYWWDDQVLDYFDIYGTDKFRKLNIWDIDWNEKARLLGRGGNYSDPRSRYEIFMHRFIEKYRENLKLRKNIIFRMANQLFSMVLKRSGW